MESSRLFFIPLLLLLAAAVLLTGCPTDPDTEKQIQETVEVPGLEQAVVAKDRAIKTAIVASWMADVELTQEQLAVEEVRAGKVRITGIVSRPELKDRAETIAREMEGVTEVVSTITVDESLKENRINLNDL
ncbi:MAG TPA: BON domain-containing protein [Firmicutes bacterium]|nr:BON domain-containing protein [Bacillota bacterium]